MVISEIFRREIDYRALNGILIQCLCERIPHVSSYGQFQAGYLKKVDKTCL